MLNLRPYPIRPVSRLLLIVASAALAACVQDESAPGENNAAENPVINLPDIPRPAPPLDRTGLLMAVAQAASAAAAGADDREAQRELDGRQFEVRIRFGCRGPREDLGAHDLSWSYDAEERRLRVRALPTLSAQDPLVEGIAGEEIEAVEGFWIPRPWLLTPVCPRAAAVAAAPPAEEAGEATDAAADQPADEAPAEEPQVPAPRTVAPKVGIAQFFTAADPHTRRRDNRAYESVTTVPQGKPIGSQGFNLVLAGRLRSMPGRPVIACAVKTPQTPPDCIVSAEFQRVWIERPGNREIVAEWGAS